MCSPDALPHSSDTSSTVEDPSEDDEEDDPDEDANGASFLEPALGARCQELPPARTSPSADVLKDWTERRLSGELRIFKNAKNALRMAPETGGAGSAPPAAATDAALALKRRGHRRLAPAFLAWAGIGKATSISQKRGFELQRKSPAPLARWAPKTAPSTDTCLSSRVRSEAVAKVRLAVASANAAWIDTVLVVAYAGWCDNHLAVRFEQCLFKHMDLKAVQRNGELVVGGDLRKKKNAWFRNAYAEMPLTLKLKRRPSGTTVLGVLESMHEKHRLCPSGMDSSAWASMQADKICSVMDRCVRSGQAVKRKKDEEAYDIQGDLDELLQEFEDTIPDVLDELDGEPMSEEEEDEIAESRNEEATDAGVAEERISGSQEVTKDLNPKWRPRIQEVKKDPKWKRIQKAKKSPRILEAKKAKKPMWHRIQEVKKRAQKPMWRRIQEVKKQKPKQKPKWQRIQEVKRRQKPKRQKPMRSQEVKKQQPKWQRIEKVKKRRQKPKGQKPVWLRSQEALGNPKRQRSQEVKRCQKPKRQKPKWLRSQEVKKGNPKWQRIKQASLKMKRQRIDKAPRKGVQKKGRGTRTMDEENQIVDAGYQGDEDYDVLFDGSEMVHDFSEDEATTPGASEAVQCSGNEARVLKRTSSASSQVTYEQKEKKAPMARLSGLREVHESVRRHAIPTPSPQEQLALLRAENASRKRRAPAEAVSTTALAGGWFKEKRKRATGKNAGQIYTVYTHQDGRQLPSRKLFEKAGGVDMSPDKRKNPKAKAAAKKPKAAAKKAKAAAKKAKAAAKKASASAKKAAASAKKAAAAKKACAKPLMDEDEDDMEEDGEQDSPVSADDGQASLMESEEVEFCAGDARFTRAMVLCGYAGKRFDEQGKHQAILEKSERRNRLSKCAKS
ncbi:unnamed protein product [Symbiodinium sp. KB8]|nr:unnamed protein product [Symbiodinium sp. KB8]